MIVDFHCLLACPADSKVLLKKGVKDMSLIGGKFEFASYDQGMGNRGEVFMTWEGFEPGTWSLELWDLKRFELRTL